MREIKFRIGCWVYIRENNDVSYGKIIQIKYQENKDTIYQVECLNDIYLDIKEYNMFLSKEDFIKDLMYYLNGNVLNVSYLKELEKVQE